MSWIKRFLGEFYIGRSQKIHCVFIGAIRDAVDNFCNTRIDEGFRAIYTG